MQRDDTAVPLLGVLSTQSHCEVLSWKPDPLSFQQCVRVTYPGGIICLTEAENGICTSPACEQISVFCAHAIRVAGHSFSPDGRHLSLFGPLINFTTLATTNPDLVRVCHQQLSLFGQHRSVGLKPLQS